MPLSDNPALEAAHAQVTAPGPRRGLKGPARVFAGPVGAVLARPWLDRVLMRALRGAYFPLSRAWGAAEASEGDPERFWADLGVPRRLDHRDAWIGRLARFEQARATSEAVAQAWQEAFFGTAEPSAVRLQAMEAARMDCAQAYGATRRLFVSTLGARVPSVRTMIPTPEEVEAAIEPDSLFRAPATFGRVRESRRVAGAVGTDHWLFFDSPSARVGGIATARVHTPDGVSDPPTVILGHGVCVEFDQWQGLIDESIALVRRGIRVIRPEAPWHGRRRPRGYFGGERMIAAFPLGALDLFSASVGEWAVLADWAIRTSRGPLAFGGSSLGALTSQLAASAAHDWPDAIRPRALFLVTHSDQMSVAMTTGPLSTMWVDPSAAAEKGWTEETARRALEPLEPSRPPVVRPERIVSVLGAQDVITPFTTGRALVERWRVPPENVFISNRGHFTIPMSLMRDPRPVDRFAAIINSID
jgi:hypothetical protein